MCRREEQKGVRGKRTDIVAGGMADRNAGGENRAVFGRGMATLDAFLYLCCRKHVNRLTKSSFSQI